MIKHVVCFKLKEGVDKQEVKGMLLSMAGKVPTAKEIEVNVDELCSSRSYDVMLTVKLESWVALDEYQKDAYHCGVVKEYMHPRSASSIAIDCEV